MDKFTVGILGLGNIGMLYDYDNRDSETFVSHAKSFSNHPNFELKYLIDVDENKRKLAEERFGENSRVLTSIKGINQFPDVFVLAASPEVNAKVFDEFKDNKEIKLFILEKPFWNSKFKYNSLIKYSQKCVINYFRKYIPLFNDIKNNIQLNNFGKPQGIHIWYSKGLRNNGSHLIDFINYLFEGNFDLATIKIIDKINDFSKNDLSISFNVRYHYMGNCFSIMFQAANEKYFSLIEMDIIFESARFRFYDFGEKVEIFKVERDPIFKNYKNMISKEILNSKINKYGYYMCDYINNVLLKKVQNISSLKHEYEVYKVIEAVRKEVK